MAVSSEFRRSMKNRRQRARRVEVGLFFMLMAVGLSESGRPLTFGSLGFRAVPYILVIARVFRVWNSQRMIPVSSLDDRAVAEYGVEFKRLGEAQQKEILQGYRVGTYLLGYFPDELEEARERESYQRAYGVLKWLLPVLAVIYWAGWRVLPEGRVRAGWTDGPVVLAWVLLLVLALPQMLRMWTEPDEVGEPKVVVMEA
jgi:hypothetical protein